MEKPPEIKGWELQRHPNVDAWVYSAPGIAIAVDERHSPLERFAGVLREYMPELLTLRARSTSLNKDDK